MIVLVSSNCRTDLNHYIKKKININIEDKQKTKCTEKCQRLTIRILKSEKRDKSFEMIKENTVD